MKIIDRRDFKQGLALIALGAVVLGAGIPAAIKYDSSRQPTLTGQIQLKVERAMHLQNRLNSSSDLGYTPSEQAEYRSELAQLQAIPEVKSGQEALWRYDHQQQAGGTAFLAGLTGAGLMLVGAVRGFAGNTW